MSIDRAATPAPGRPRRVDAHHHLWDLAVRPQGWTKDLPQLDRTFTFADLAPHLAASGIDATVLVETINIAPETGELLALAAQTPQVAGVVGWVDLTAPDVAQALAALRAGVGGEHLVAVRHQVQGEQDPAWLARPDVLAGIREVAQAGLVFDLLVKPHQMPAALVAVQAIPGARFVLEHLGKPDIAAGMWQPWADQVATLASFPHVACKLSGMVTEAAPTWTAEQLRPYAAHVLEHFGPERVMAGSDWPVCLLRGSHEDVWGAQASLLDDLSPGETDEVLGGTAERWYGLA